MDREQLEDPDFSLVDRSVLGNAFKKLNRTLRQLEKVWESSYIDLIHSRDAKQLGPGSKPKKGEISAAPQVGDVVLLINDKNKLGGLSRVLELHKSKDRKVRLVKIINEKGASASWWPLSKISFFECADPKSLPDKFTTKVQPEKLYMTTRARRRLAEADTNLLPCPHLS